MDCTKLMKMDLTRSGNSMEDKKTTTSTKTESQEEFLRFQLTIPTSSHTQPVLLTPRTSPFLNTVKEIVEEVAQQELSSQHDSIHIISFIFLMTILYLK